MITYLFAAIQQLNFPIMHHPPQRRRSWRRSTSIHSPAASSSSCQPTCTIPDVSTIDTCRLYACKANSCCKKHGELIKQKRAALRWTKWNNQEQESVMFQGGSPQQAVPRSERKNQEEGMPVGQSKRRKFLHCDSISRDFDIVPINTLV